MPITKAQQKATAKYQKANYDDIKVRVSKGKREIIKNYAESKGYHFYETSAKTGHNIKEAFDDMFEQLYQNFEGEITGKKQVNAGIQIKKSKGKNRRCC